MQHMVVYGSADGKPNYFQAEDLDGAVRFVEHLVNVENVTDSRIFQLQEVAIEFKTYYRVQLSTAGGAVGDAPEVPAMDPVPADAPAADAGDAELADAMPIPAPASRFGIFSRT